MESWDRYGLYVLKSIERIESALRTIDEAINGLVEKFNNKIEKNYKELKDDIDKEISCIKKDIAVLKSNEKTNELALRENKVKLGFVIAFISLLISSAITILAKCF